MAGLKELKSRLEKIMKLLEKLDERLALGDINEAHYKQLSGKYKAEASDLKNQITEKELRNDVGLDDEKEESEASDDSAEESESEQKHSNYIPLSVLDGLPSMVRSSVVNLSAQKQAEFIEEYKRNKKSNTTMFILWLFGLEYAYVKKWGVQILFWITVGGLFIWWLIDIFRIGGMVSDYNKDVATDVLKNMKAVSA